MKKGMFFLTVVVVLNMVGVSWAAQGDVDIDVTWVSKYIWRGIDKLDDKAALQPSVNVDLGQGLSLNVLAILPGSSKGGGRVGTVNLEEWNYTLAYGGSTFEGEAYKTDYTVLWRYYDYPDTATKDADMQEFAVAISMPDICEAGIVPSYVIVQTWPAKGGGAVRASGGFVHVLGLGYQYTCPDLPELPLDLSWSIVYNDGTYGTTIDHDWSHMVYGVSTTIDCPTGGKITPAVYYQVSMEDTVNKQDEFWAGISYGLSF